MKYIVVTYPEVRDVYIGDSLIGKTNIPIPIDPGQYNFHLGSPADYEPNCVSATVTENEGRITSPIMISFEPRLQ